MQFSSSFLAATLALMSSVTASPIEARQATLQDWQVTKLGIYSPSGRPGNNPWSTITVSITDPNEYNLGTSTVDGTSVIVPGGSQGLNCEAKYISRAGDSPLNHLWPCQSDSYENDYWYMRIVEGSDGKFSPTDFKIEFTHVLDLIKFGSQFTATVRGEQLFKVGTNMQGSCGSSGVCSWGLKAENKPQPITPTKL